MQAITTKYLGPTDHRGGRIVAKCDAKRITVPWDHALGIEENHRAACRQLIVALGWDQPCYKGRFYGGALPGGGSVFVYVAPGSEAV